MKLAIIALVLTALQSTAVAQSACSGQQYNNIPGFPNSNQYCYPLNYYRTSDLGSTSPSDAMQRCQQQCTADSSCNSVVAQVNKAADSNTYSGTCFFYAQGQTVTPRQCASGQAYLLEGYQKDYTLQCYSSSLPAASAFCSSYLNIPVKTSTVTATPSPVTTTNVVSTTLSATVTVSTPVLLTSTLTSFTTTTLVAGTTTITATNTVTKTSTSTTTTTVNKRATKKKRAAASPTPACVTSGTPASRLSAACSCLSVPTSTTTVTTTLTPKTSTQSSTSSITNTITATVPGSTTTSYVSVTVTVTAQTTASTTITSMTTTTTTTTTTATTTCPADAPTYCANDGGCHDTTADYRDCGACGNTCGTNSICQNSQCVTNSNPGCTGQGTPCGDPTRCSCARDISGQYYCSFNACSNQACNVDADCGNSIRCLLNSSCGSIECEDTSQVGTNYCR